jgi:hypothetical protein
MGSGPLQSELCGKLWTNEPLPDDEHLSPAHKAAREAAYHAGMEKMGAAKAAPTYTQQDAWDLSELLASNGIEGLPHGSHIETRAEDNSTPLSRPYGATYVDRATSVSIPIIGTFTPRELLETGLVTKGGRWNHVAYEAAVKATPGVIEGKLIGPRDVILDKQRAAQKRYPQLWRS